MSTEYASLGEAEQVAALRPVAVEAAQRFGLDVVELSILLHAYNTTFAAHLRDGSKVAIRVCTHSQSTTAHALAQQSWIAALGTETELLVPEPLRTPTGEWFVEVDSAALGRPLLVTVASWLDGEDADDLVPAAAFELGRTMARLHEHAAGWVLPSGAELPTLDDPFFGDAVVLEAAPGLSADDREVLAMARARVCEVFARLHEGATLRPLHADLHGGNLKWHEGRLAVFDFDDAGFGLPALDLAIATFYLRGDEPALEAALREGYATVRPLPTVRSEDFEALVASRQLLLANDMFSMQTEALRGEAVDYVHTAARRLRGWFESGSFTRSD